MAIIKAWIALLTALTAQPEEPSQTWDIDDIEQEFSEIVVAELNRAEFTEQQLKAADLY